MTTKQLITWTEFHQACDDLTDQLRGDRRVTKNTIVIGISRGGLVPAGIIAYGLRLQAWAMPIQSLERYYFNSRSSLLIIDDICDTGRTFENYRLKFGDAVYAAPYVKPKGRPLCNYWTRSVRQDTWVVFPYAPDDDVNR
jgi:xanthine phosphoribosyltransferase